MSINIGHESILQMHDLYVEKMQFVRGKSGSPTEQSFNAKVTREDKVFDNGEYGVKLTIILSSENDPDFTVEVTMVGIFSISEDLSDDVRKSILKINTTSIMFPYLRSQLSLLTTQPGFQPITLPPMNISAMLADQEEGQSEHQE